MLTPEQIETMRKIARGIEPDIAAPTLPAWAVNWMKRPMTLTEAGAEVLRLWEEFAEAKRERLEVGLRAGFDVGALEEERDTLRAALEEANRKAEALITRPWGLLDVLRRLVEGADHLLYDHGCDQYGYETLVAARDSAVELLPLVAAMIAADKATS